jgi:hypothetical protein
MSIPRREVLACVVAAVLVLPAGADPVGKEPLTPEQAWRQEDGVTITARFEVRKDFAVADAAEGEIYLVHLMSSGRSAEDGQSSFRVVVTEKCRKDFTRIGVSALGTHFAGRVVTVRGKVSRVDHPGPSGHTGGMHREHTPLVVVALTIDSLDQFVSVR